MLHRLGVVFLLSALSPAQDPLFLVDGLDPLLRDRLLAAAALHADLGAHAVARLSPPLRAACAVAGAAVVPLAEPPAGLGLLALQARNGAAAAHGLPVLLDHHGLLLVLATPADLLRARQPGTFGGGVQAIDTTTPCRPAAPPPTPAVEAADARLQALLPQLTAANLSTHIAALSAIQTRRADQAANAQAVSYLQAQLAQIPGLSVSTQTFRAGYGPNVVAELPGREAPGEIAMIGAHFDSYAGSGTARAPGADDNASGTATVLEVARLLAQLPLRRTVRFCFWNAEEFGLYGSAAYAQAARARNDTIVGYLNADMNAYRAAGDATDLDFVTNNSDTALRTFLTQVSQTYVPSLPVVAGALGAGSSDHASFFAQGYPAVFYFEDIDHYSPYIHSANDTAALSTNDLNLAVLISQSMLAGLGELAQLVALPAFTLDLAQGPTLGGTTVVATGTGLLTATQVRVGGTAVAATPGPGTLTFATPMANAAGPVWVEITNAAGPNVAPFTYVLTSPPGLRLPTALPHGGAGTGAVAGQPDHFAATLVSLLPGPTALPGLPPLGLGGGQPGEIATFDFGVLSAGGGTRALALQLPANPALVGLQAWFQSLQGDAALASLAVTNAVAFVVQ